MTHTAYRFIDPTDDHRPTLPAHPREGAFNEVLDTLLWTVDPDALPYTEPLTEAHWQRGICSDPTCSKAISGWCVHCRAKLCIDHLQDHRNVHAREHIAALRVE